MTQYIKRKFSHYDINIWKANKIFYGRYSNLDWRNSTKNKTSLFVNKNDKYKEKNLKKTDKQLRKKKFCLKWKSIKRKIC